MIGDGIFKLNKKGWDYHMEKFGRLIREYRKAHKLTQDDFAKLINKTQVTVSNYEKDIHFPSNAEEIDAISKLLNQNASRIIESIKYSRNGIVEEEKSLPIELSQDSLLKRVNLIIDDVEITERELNKMIHIVRFERFVNK